MRASLLWDVTQRILVVTDVSVQPVLDCFTLEDGTEMFFSETSVPNYQATLRNISEERRYHSALLLSKIRFQL
jgi:hypothetical protein